MGVSTGSASAEYSVSYAEQIADNLQISLRQVYRVNILRSRHEVATMSKFATTDREFIAVARKVRVRKPPKLN